MAADVLVWPVCVCLLAPVCSQHSARMKHNCLFACFSAAITTWKPTKWYVTGRGKLTRTHMQGTTRKRRYALTVGEEWALTLPSTDEPANDRRDKICMQKKKEKWKPTTFIYSHLYCPGDVCVCVLAVVLVLPLMQLQTNRSVVLTF